MLTLLLIRSLYSLGKHSQSVKEQEAEFSFVTSQKTCGLFVSFIGLGVRILGSSVPTSRDSAISYGRYTVFAQLLVGRLVLHYLKYMN